MYPLEEHLKMKVPALCANQGYKKFNVYLEIAFVMRTVIITIARKYVNHLLYSQTNIFEVKN